MRAPITVVIPTLNAAEGLSNTLGSLVEGLDAELIRDVIVTDGGSGDATYEVADAWGATWITGDASRGGQLRRGCAEAKGDWLMVLHADTVLLPGWSGPVRAHLAGAHAGYFALRFDRGGRFVAAWANLRARLFGLPYGDQGLLVPSKLYREIGGYQDIPLMEDVAIARALRGKLRHIDAVAVTSAQRYRERGWLGQGARNLWTLVRYFLGVSPERLAESYRSKD